jgi:Tfp pilus assembly protein PilF
MSALRHYRRAVEQADLYEDIQMFKNEVKYKLKEKQHALETEGLTKEQLKAKFDKQIADAKADMAKEKEKMEDHHRHHDKK